MVPLRYPQQGNESDILQMTTDRRERYHFAGVPGSRKTASGTLPAFHGFVPALPEPASSFVYTGEKLAKHVKVGIEEARALLTPGPSLTKS
jgi:hypothetical protein